MNPNFNWTTKNVPLSNFSQRTQSPQQKLIGVFSVHGHTICTVSKLTNIDHQYRCFNEDAQPLKAWLVYIKKQTTSTKQMIINLGHYLFLLFQEKTTMNQNQIYYVHRNTVSPDIVALSSGVFPEQKPIYDNRYLHITVYRCSLSCKKSFSSTSQKASRVKRI